ncbi:MAG: Lrp/AsnC family transcriptional regulator [Thaumarchaeota archaeon]|nr:Lrp/AsnC family transcriptional regulator [Nitrososphaerota archaeon]
MDQLDIRIFRTLGLFSFGEETYDISRLNPWVIAKKIGANGRTVKLRLKRMQKSGFIQYFQIYPNFRLLGLGGSGYVFNVANVKKKYEVIDSCSIAEGITEVHNFMGENVCVEFTYQDSRDEERRLKLLRRLTDCESPTKVYDRVMPPLLDKSLNSTDWRIIKALRYNALRPHTEVAKELGLTAKTVRRRFERMVRNNALVIMPMINPSHLANALTYVIQVFPSPEKWDGVVESVMSVFSGSYLLTRMWRPKWVAVYLTAQTLADTEDNIIKVSQIEGVKDSRILVLKEIRDYSHWLDSTIDLKIKETSDMTHSSSAGLGKPVILQ